MATAMTGTQWELCLGFIFTQTESWPLWPGQALRRTKTGKGQYGKRRSHKMERNSEGGFVDGSCIGGESCMLGRTPSCHPPTWKEAASLYMDHTLPPPHQHQRRWLSGPNQATDREQFCESERGATLPITVSCASSTGPPTNQPTAHPSFHQYQVGWVKQN